LGEDGGVRGLGLYTAGGDLESAETAEIAETKTRRVCGGVEKVRCGGRGSRTCRRAYPAANDLSRTFGDLGRLNGLHNADSMLDSLISDGSYPPGVIGPVLRSARRHPLPGIVVRPLTGLREVQYHLTCNACWPARKPLGLRCGGASLLLISG
jgi:hypothetical protein